MTPWTAPRQASLSITNSRSLFKLMPIESVMPSNHLILCRSLLLLPSLFPSIRVFSSELVLHIRWPKYWSFSFSISPSNEYSGLISFRMDWLALFQSKGLSRVFSKTLCSSPWTLYSPWNSPGQNTGVGSLSLLQGTFPTQGSNPGLLYCRWILYQLSHKGRPYQIKYLFKTYATVKSGESESVSRSVVSDSVTPWTVACQAPLSTGFYRQEHWSGLPFLSPGDLPNLGIEPRLFALQVDSLPSESPGQSQREGGGLHKTPPPLPLKIPHTDTLPPNTLS